MRSYSFHSMVKKYVNSSFILVLVTIIALIVANSPAGYIYDYIWNIPITVSIGRFNLFSQSGETLTLMTFINDFLMAVFFFSVGLEIKREILVGELSSFKKALLPIIGACGGMLVPVFIFILLCPDNPMAMQGMAIPMATDIAFSLGVLSIFGKRVPLSLKVFLAALAVADDLGGIIIIALFYSSQMNIPYLIFALILVFVLLIGNYYKVRAKMFYIFVGVFVWYMILNSGIHATIAGVIVAFCVPAGLSSSTFYFVERIRRNINQFPHDPLAKRKAKALILTEEQIGLLKSIESASDHVISPLQDMEDSLHNPINYFIIPVFAFANAGINFAGMSLENLFSGVGLAVMVGLVVGKIIGIFSFSWIAIKSGWVSMPEGANWKSFVSVCMLGGIGFTVSMFIADLSYGNLGDAGFALLNDAKLGILVGSLCAGILGWFFLSKTLPQEDECVNESDILEAEKAARESE